mgnify:CR=1 FL=1
MHEGAINLVAGQLSGDGPMDTAVSRALLLAVAEGTLGETIQVGTPHRVMAFGKHDTLTDGFARAVDVARDAGYDPTIRIAGGRAVVFSPTIVRFAWTLPVAEPAPTMHERFRTLADAVVRTLVTLGAADAAVGEIPNEYCAGEYSVHVLGSRKVMGVGQRLTRSAAQVGGMIVVDDPDDINGVLVPVYEALGVPMEPGATGSIADVVEVDADTVSDVFVGELAGHREVAPMALPDSILSRAEELRHSHVPGT